MKFEDNFSRQASEYVRHRPHYPGALFEYIASIAPAHDLAWDCGTGNGQAAISLARHFERVIATDASSSQIEHALPHDRVEYQVTPAERTDIPSSSVDVVTVAQAIHWFDLDAFYAEACRVLKPDGALVAWTYHLAEITPAVDDLVARFYFETVAEYWSPKIRLVNELYSTLPFPFRGIPVPSFTMEAMWTMHDLIGFLSSWSARQKFMQERGYDPIDDIRDELAEAWGRADEAREVRWRLYVRAGYKGEVL